MFPLWAKVPFHSKSTNISESFYVHYNEQFYCCYIQPFTFFWILSSNYKHHTVYITIRHKDECVLPSRQDKEKGQFLYCKFYEQHYTRTISRPTYVRSPRYKFKANTD